jgi:hypothetical protein
MSATNDPHLYFTKKVEESESGEQTLSILNEIARKSVNNNLENKKIKELKKLENQQDQKNVLRIISTVLTDHQCNSSTTFTITTADTYFLLTFYGVPYIITSTLLESISNLNYKYFLLNVIRKVYIDPKEEKASFVVEIGTTLHATLVALRL